ncbi:MAG: hypothetical protein AB7W28_01265 [Armatimonadota bacterium]
MATMLGVLTACGLWQGPRMWPPSRAQDAKVVSYFLMHVLHRAKGEGMLVIHRAKNEAVAEITLGTLAVHATHPSPNRVEHVNAGRDHVGQVIADRAVTVVEHAGAS